MKQLIWGCTVTICGTLTLLTGLLCLGILLLLIAMGGYFTGIAVALFLLTFGLVIVGALLITKGKNAVNAANVYFHTKE